LAERRRWTVKRALAFHVTGDFFTAVYSETQGPSRKILNTDIVSFPAAPAARISLTVQANRQHRRFIMWRVLKDTTI
jgi:hypothetical protein